MLHQGVFAEEVEVSREGGGHLTEEVHFCSL